MTRLFVYEAVSAGAFGNNPPISLDREGQAMLGAVARDFHAVPGVQVLTVLRPGLAPSAFEGVECRVWSGASEETAFAQLLGESDAALVIAPELGGLLARRSAAVEDAGRRSLGCAAHAVCLAADKLALYQRWRDACVPTPTTYDATCAKELALRGPVVLKPRRGAGSLATRRIDNPALAEAVLRELALEAPSEEFLLQPWHDGLAASVSFLCGPAGDTALLPGEQLLSDDGRCTYLGTRLPLDEPWRQRAVALGRRALSVFAGRNGYVGIDLVLGPATDGSTDVAIEINPRLTTSYLELRRKCAGNLAQAWLQTAAGLSADLRWRT
jgi:predicted ATP-grasp superfamily ATP-dependent carboligase